MIRRLSLSVILILFLSGVSSPQDIADKVLMTVNGTNVTAGEFIRMYRKSYEPGNTKDLDKYLEQFILFKLKVADAVSSGYDTTKAFRTELSGYRNQVAQNYLSDQEVREKLIKQAYQRSLTEINAWHILIGMPPDASSDDTLKAWKKAKDVRERIIQGESFEQVARSTSDDPSVKLNGGNLGYFSVFQMIMPFEDAAYTLKKGQISEPVRTPFGYHIIRVADRRPSGGKIKVAHIMRTVPPGSPENVEKAARDTIASVYRQLLAGSSFSDLAAKYSDHRETSLKGGELNWFGAGEIVSDFAEAAFSLQKNGDFTMPVKTVYGWHIIKRIDKKAPGTFEETRGWLESKINESYLNSLSRKSFIEKLKKEYRYRLIKPAFDWFVSNTDTLIIKGLAKYKRQGMPGGALYTFADQQMTTREFASYVEKRGLMIDTDDPARFIAGSIETCLSDQMIKYENSVLEKKYPEFRYLMKEFHDGILLFEISGNKVWNKAQDDSAGLKKYYEENRHRFVTKEAVEGKLYILSDKDRMKSLLTAYKKYEGRPDADSRLTKRFIVRNDTLLSIETGKWRRGDNSDLDRLEWGGDLIQFTYDGYPALLKTEKHILPEPLPFAEIQGEMISGYQDDLEKKWTVQLKESYSVKVNDSVFDEIRKKLDNE